MRHSGGHYVGSQRVTTYRLGTCFERPMVLTILASTKCEDTPYSIRGFSDIAFRHHQLRVRMHHFSTNPIPLAVDMDKPCTIWSFRKSSRNTAWSALCYLFTWYMLAHNHWNQAMKNWQGQEKRGERFLPDIITARAARQARNEKIRGGENEEGRYLMAYGSVGAAPWH